MTDKELKKLISEEIEGLLSEQPVGASKAPPIPRAPKSIPSPASNDVNGQLQKVKQELEKLEKMIAGK